MFASFFKCYAHHQIPHQWKEDLQMLAAKFRDHLSNENLETIFLLVALKLPAKNLHEYEQEIRHVEGKLTVSGLILENKGMCAV